MDGIQNQARQRTQIHLIYSATKFKIAPLHTELELQPSHPLSYRPEIDGLRAIAVLSVVLYHAGQGPASGFVGVDMFFVISGYLITSLIHRESRETGKIDLFAFYARRVKRILPALLFVLLVTVATSMIVLSPYGEKKELSRSAAAALGFVGNIYFQTRTGGYFDSIANHLPTLHLWSLSVEEQFYVVWPLLLLALRGVAEKSRIGLIALLAMLSFATAETLLYFSPNMAFFQMPARFWELAIGGITALLPNTQQRGHRLELTSGVTLVLVAVFVPIAHFPGYGALPAVAGAALIIHGVHIASVEGIAAQALRSRPMVFFGLTSYSLYLWHWPLLSIYRSRHPGPIDPLHTTALLVSAAALAWLSYRFVERPFRRPTPGTSNKALVASSLFALAASAFFILQLGSFFHQDLYHASPKEKLAQRTESDMPENRLACHYTGFEPPLPFPKPGCLSAAHKPVRVLIWGDSHALAWEPMARILAQRMNVSATSHTRDACPPALNYHNGKRERETNDCIKFNQLSFKSITKNGFDTLILSALWPPPQKNKEFYRDFEQTVLQALPMVRKVIILGPTPYLRDSAPRCIRTGELNACAISRDDFNAQSTEPSRQLRSLAKRNAKIRYVDLADFFCTKKYCPVLKNGYALYWDTNHVSATAARRFSEKFQEDKQEQHP
ncbi:acyltransferase family protein [Niveibacterium terrae]|uniref:acyltransferase family protein n=1 Tax=Niveibacterium terrae TaxID=3373598 RepID=UPI003A950643